jgi:beta-RFAP synthase
LHFGLLRFEQAEGPSFGGLGMMIREPRWTVRIEPACQWFFEGPGAERAAELAVRLWERLATAEAPPALRVSINSAIPLHHGFGGGTQLALAVAAGIRLVLNLGPVTPEDLASMTGRGKRSAVGTHGFLHGGLIWETGLLPGENLGRLAARVAIPEDWHIVLVTPTTATGLSGEPEKDAFATLPPVAPATTEQLMSIAEQRILPAARGSVFDDFSEGVYEFGRLAGECFAPVQGGSYASPAIAECVQVIRRFGLQGVGQSSWGPTVFAFTKDEEQAQWLCGQVGKRLDAIVSRVQITQADNRGALLNGGSISARVSKES